MAKELETEVVKLVEITKEYKLDSNNSLKETYDIKVRHPSNDGSNDYLYNLTANQIRALKKEINDLV